MKTIKSSQKIIAFYPELARELGDIDSAIFYQQLYFWSSRGERDDGFIYKTKEEIEEETTIKRHTQDRVRKNLIKQGWIEVKKIKVKGAPILHYKCLKDIKISFFGKATNRLMEKPQNDFSEKPQTDFSEKPQTDFSSIYIDNNIDNYIDNTQEVAPIDTMVKENSFNQFWVEYPKKENKTKAKEKWFKKGFEKDIDKILGFIKEAKKTDRWKRGFIKDPVTFLNNQSWYDDLTWYDDRPSSPAGVHKDRNENDYMKNVIKLKN